MKCTFIIAYEEQIKYLPKSHYGLASVLIAFRILKTNVSYVQTYQKFFCKTLFLGKKDFVVFYKSTNIFEANT